MLTKLNPIKKFKKTKTKLNSDAISVDNTPFTYPVSSGNPCPFLRGLVGTGLINNGEVPINKLLDAIDDMVATRDNGTPDLPRSGLRAVALTANGFMPTQVTHNLRHGVNIDKLREDPYYKHGVHTRTLAETGEVNQDQLVRLSKFGSPKIDKAGKVELGLNKAEINSLLRANFLRGAYPGYHRSPKHIPIMKAEYPVLLQVMGKEGRDERYLSISELSDLLYHNKFPDRMVSRLNMPKQKKSP